MRTLTAEDQRTRNQTLLAFHKAKHWTDKSFRLDGHYIYDQCDGCGVSIYIWATNGQGLCSKPRGSWLGKEKK